MVSDSEAPYPFISVVIPFFNAGETIETTLTSLLESDYPRFEILCVDDCSTDKSADAVRKHPVALFRLDSRSGAAVARNLGAKNASGEILFFIDADVAALPDTLYKIAETFRLHPEISACFGEYTPLPLAPNFASVYKNLVHHFTHQHARSEAHTFWCGCGAIRTEVFRAIGGFDESYEASSVEDIELGYRLTGAGYRVLLNKEIRVSHAKYYTLRSLIRSDVFDRAIPWTLLMARKNVFYPDLNLRAANIASALILVLLLPFSVAAVFVLGADIVLYAPPAVAAVYLILNGRIFLFALKVKGPVFLINFMFMYTFTYLYSVVGFAVGVALFLAEKIRPSGKKPK